MDIRIKALSVHLLTATGAVLSMFAMLAAAAPRPVAGGGGVYPSMPPAALMACAMLRAAALSPAASAFFSAAKSLGVCLTPTKMYLSSIDYFKPSAFGQYLVEIVTTSRMSMIFRAMRDAKTDARATLRQCPLAENKLYPNDTIEEQIEAVEQLEIQRRIACAKQM
jgi:hypothetical protein